MDSSTRVPFALPLPGFDADSASDAIGRLMRCGHRVRTEALASFPGRLRLLVRSQHNPQIQCFLYDLGAVTRICADSYNLPLSPARPLASFDALGRYRLLGVR